MSSQLSTKVVVFDLDETLGYFLELGVFWEVLLLYAKPTGLLTQEVFNQVLDLYPEFLRVNILAVLKYLKRLKTSGKCRSVMIYTNNKGPVEWVQMIKTYIHGKLECDLFDQVIGAFRRNGEHFEICRTTNEKTKKDLIRCTKLPEDIEICFVDNEYHANMNLDDVYYIKVITYIYTLPVDTMITRFVANKISKTFVANKADFVNFAKTYMRRYSSIYNIPKTPEEYEIDKIVTKQLMVLLQDFFK
jgi:hypothetical protein